MAHEPEPKLSRREREIMDIVYRRGRASVGEVLEDMPDPPSYSAVRALMGIMLDKGHLKRERVGTKYIYSATRSRRHAGRSALSRVLETFFDGSAEKAVAALLETADSDLTPAELDRLAQLIEQARKEGQ
jgi:predicted transcriptional regulator